MHVSCRMLYEQQELYYSPNINYEANERVAYLNPIDICQEWHTFIIRNDNEELLGLEGEECAAKIKPLKLKFESEYAFYIGQSLKTYQDRELVVLQYHFG